LLATLLAGIASFPVVIVAFVKLWRGHDTPWVVISLVFSLPVAILSLIAVTRTAMASNSAYVSDAYVSAQCAFYGAPQRER
jgi:hypothetical protein